MGGFAVCGHALKVEFQLCEGLAGLAGIVVGFVKGRYSGAGVVHGRRGGECVQIFAAG